jgi:hypothetical protein
MSRILRWRRTLRVASVVLASYLLLVLLLGQGPVSTLAASAELDQAQTLAQGPLQSQAKPEPSVPDAPVDCGDTTCPTSEFGNLDWCVQRTKFCVYYNTDSISEAEAEWAADWVEDYWNRFVALGFNEPKYLVSPDNLLEVYLVHTTSDCNGGTGWSDDDITTYSTCFANDEQAQKVLGHELTHRVQYNHDTGTGAPIQTKFLKEGTARASEDNWFANIDNWPQALAFSSFNTEANNYLADPNHDITSIPMRYKSCLWWKYGSEQYGTILTEPERGVDFFLTVYNANTAGFSSIAAVNRALGILETGVDFDESFTQFAVAIWTKDLTGVPDDSYNFIDEEEAGNPAIYGPVARDPGGTILLGNPPADWTGEAITRYGIKVFEANPGGNCPVVTASFHSAPGDPAFYHVVTQDGSTFKTHVQGSGTDWVQSFMNDGITKIAAIVGSLDGSSTVDVSLECVDPVLEIQLPNDVAVAHVHHPSKFLAQVFVTNGSPTGPVVAGLSNSDFKAKVNNLDANVAGGGFIQESYWLVIETPDGLADGTYDLEVILEEPGTSTPLDTDTSPNSIVHTSQKTDHVLVIDRSGSMGWPIEPTHDKLIAAKAAASFYVDITQTDDGVAVVPYNGNVNPSPFPMQSVDATVRTAAKAYIDDWSEPDGIFPGGTTSIGDGLYEAVNQRENVSTTGNPLCSFVLLSDGMENSYRFWSGVKTDVQDTGCPVTAIAFGPESNETLMQTIATETGGLSYYNDVYVSTTEGERAISREDMHLDLGNTYAYAQGLAEGYQRMLAEKGIASSYDADYVHPVVVDAWMTDVLFALDWFFPDYYHQVELKLRKPDGTIIDPTSMPYTFEDRDNHGHLGWRLPYPDPGTWEMLVRRQYTAADAAADAPELQGVYYQVLASGRSNLTMHTLLPGQMGYLHTTGLNIPIYAILSADSPIPCGQVEALVTNPSGFETRVPLFDDGEHGDGVADDGLCAGLYTRLNQAQQVQPPEEDGVPSPTADDEGGYSVRLIATGDGDTPFQREGLGSFMVLEGEDSDGDGMPDGWEEDHDVDDPLDDPDLDCLWNGLEYPFGTDPNNSDSDGGGENDFYELANGQEPLDPVDDEIEAPDFFHAAPADGAVHLTYDVKAEYTQMYLFRSESPEGPWSCAVQHVSALPLTGEYTDPAVNGTTYHYRLIAWDGVHASATLDSEGVTPSADPVPPEARVIIDSGRPSTDVRDVTLTFGPYPNEPDDPDSFSDIDEMILSNDPTFTGASWQAFYQGVPWVLGGPPNAVNQVYARFRDTSDNETVGTEVGLIFYDPDTIYLPIVIRSN